MRVFIVLVLLLCCSYCESQQFTIEALQLKPPGKLLCTPVKDQAMSSTCWSFASNSQIESEIMRNGKKGFDLSEMYIARHSWLRKINQHLRLKGTNFLTAGGQFHDVMWVIKNFGMMPESAYSGKVNDETTHNHNELDTMVNRFVQKLLAQGKTKPDSADLVYINRQLDKYLGAVPSSFMYNGKKYTAKSFAAEELGFNPDDYVEITSYTHHPFFKPFVLEDKYNWTGDEYYNVPLDDFSLITDNALQNNYTVGWDGDADDLYFDYNAGLAYLPIANKDVQQQRQTAFENKSTLLNHMMHIVATVKDKNGDKWYYIKNSWGSNTNMFGGYLFMKDDYFKIRTVAISVNKKAIPASIRKKMGI
jgi:bleomycin hydrolase